MSDGIDYSCDVYPWAATAACKMQKTSPAKILADAEANYKKIMTDMSQMVQNYIANNQERFWGSLLNMDQQIKSGDMTLATGSVDANSLAFYTECSKSEKKPSRSPMRLNRSSLFPSLARLSNYSNTKASITRMKRLTLIHFAVH